MVNGNRPGTIGNLLPCHPVQPGGRLDSLQALRFVAAFAVMIHHSLTAFGPALTNVSLGAAGVDIFFVISGVVIGYVDHDDGALKFALKRVVRVIPLYWLATLIYGIFRFYVWHDEPTTERILRSLFLIPDFGGPWVPIYYPAWTLCFELAFYMLFGALLPLTGRNTPFATAMIAVCLAALPIPVPFAPGAFFNTPLFAEFASGLVLAEAWRRGFSPTPRLGVLAVVLACVGFAARPDYPGDLRILHWGVPALLLVVGGLSLERLTLFHWKPLRLAGDASYALYLFHIPVMEGIVMAGAAAEIRLSGRIRYLALRETLLLGTALAAGIAIHVCVERPMLRGLRRLIPGPVKNNDRGLQRGSKDLSLAGPGQSEGQRRQTPRRL